MIDVREENEFNAVNLDGELIPLGQISEREDDINIEGRVVIHCKLVGRSAKGVKELEEKFGFGNLYNLKGEIFAWIVEIQPELSKY